MKGTVIAMQPASEWRRHGLRSSLIFRGAIAVVSGVGVWLDQNGLFGQLSSLVFLFNFATLTRSLWLRRGPRRITLTGADLRIRDVTHRVSADRGGPIVVPRSAITSIEAIDDAVPADSAASPAADGPPVEPPKPWFIDVSRGTRQETLGRERDATPRDFERMRAEAQADAERLRPAPNVRISVRDGHDVYVRTWIGTRIKVWWTLSPKREPIPPTEILVDVRDTEAAVALTRRWLADTPIVATEVRGARTH